MTEGFSSQTGGQEMSEKSHTGPDPALARRLRRAILRARIVLAWERLWPALWPAVMVAGLLLLYLLSGLPLLLPGWARFAVMIVFLGLGLWSLRHLRELALPDEREALLRVERESGLRDHPLHALSDHVAAPAESPLARRLWERHVRRLRERIGRLRAGFPRSAVPARDPFALRNALALALIVVLFLFGTRHLGPGLSRLIPGMSLPGGQARAVDAWLTPPAYTGRPPLVLASGEAENAATPSRQGEVYSVPAGTRLSVRVTAARAPVLTLYELRPDASAAGRRLAAIALAPAEANKNGTAPVTFQADQGLRASVVAVLTDGGELARWKIEVTPDHPPRVFLEERPAATAGGSLRIAWRVEDDYGVTRLRALFDLAEPAVSPPHAEKKASSTPPRGLPRRPLAYEAPRFTIPLPRLNPRKARGEYTRDLAAHPWAGMRVRLVLEAEDQAGQKGESRPLFFILPGRAFRHPLARALMEQRRQLVLRPWTAREVAVMLAAFTTWPEGLIKDSAVYLGLRQAARRLHGARDEKTLREVVDALWHIAVRIEDGDLADARRELQAARRALEEALERGASPEEIRRLMNRLREAMNRYLESLARQAGRQGQGERPSDNMAAREISPQDLQKMLDRIEDLARTGSRDAARQLLSELDSLLQNLRPGGREMAGSNPDARILSELQRLLRDQQRLMDETWQARPRSGRQDGQRQGRGGREAQNDPGRRGQNDGGTPMPGAPLPGGRGHPGERSDGQIAPGQNGNRPGGSGGFGDLARRQQELARRLNRLLDEMRRRGGNPPAAMNRAEESMNRAGRALRQGGKRDALDSQRQALDALREGARELARQMAQRGRSQGLLGRRGGRDPLGRPLRQYGNDYGPWENMVPDENAVERARRILEALRERAARPDRPKTELDYIDRLLRGLY